MVGFERVCSTTMRACPSRFRPFGPLAIVVGVTFVGPVACTDHSARVERQMQDLRTEISELRRSRAEHRSRLEEIQSRVFIVEDRMDTARLAEQRQGRMPELPVVALRPGVRPSGLGVSAVAEPVPVLRVGPSPRSTSPKPSSASRKAKDPYADADRRGIEAGARLEVSPIPPAPKVSGGGRKRHGGAKKAAAAAAGAGHASKAYKTAYEAMKAGRIDVALAQFRSFGEAFPKHDLSDNAQYWIGECFYARKEFRDALREFRKVIDDHPTGNKVPDSLLKIGLSYQSLGDGRTAKDVLDQVVEIFPESSAAAIARERLSRL